MIDLLSILACTVELLSRLWVLNDDLESALGELGLLLTAAALVLSALLDGVAYPQNLTKTCLVVLGPLDIVHRCLVRLVYQELGAVIADAPEHFSDVLDEAAMEDWKDQLNVAEVTWALLVVYKVEFRI